MRQNNRMSSMVAQEVSNDDNHLAAAYGYTADSMAEQPEQVIENQENKSTSVTNLCRFNSVKLSHIKPEPTQLLTVYSDLANTNAVHIEIDSGATVNYIHESFIKKYNLSSKVRPNGQLSTLGDGITKLGSIGEIDITFFRNDWKVRFRGIVVKELQSLILGGTVFLVDNQIEQNLFKKVIHIHDRRYTVQQTDPTALLPIQSIAPDVPSINNMLHIDQSEDILKNTPVMKTLTVTCKSVKVILPGQSMIQNIKAPDNSVVAIEPWEKNKNPDWPEPQLCTVQDQKQFHRTSHTW